MRIRFWGTRGSLPKPGPDTLRFGGNTSCVEVRTAGGTLVIVDCGTGIHGLGQALSTHEGVPLRGNILISHTHWDHIQGLPFFAALFKEGSEWDIYMPPRGSASPYRIHSPDRCNTPTSRFASIKWAPPYRRTRRLRVWLSSPNPPAR
jgi:glyoxylase-like metal-dependent hydrolase (beta-lactamase superfamily II)